MVRKAPIENLTIEELPNGGYIWLDDRWQYYNAKQGFSIRIGLQWHRLGTHSYAFKAWKDW